MPERSPIMRALAVALGIALIAGALSGLFVAGVAWTMRCDNTCSAPLTASWGDDRHAWQWTAQFVLAAAGFCAASGATRSLFRSRYRRMAIWGTSSAAAFGGWALLLHNAPWGGF